MKKVELKKKRSSWNRGLHVRLNPKGEFKKGCVSIFKGKHHTLESRKKMSESAKKKFFSEEHRKNLGKHMKGNKNLLGFKHSEETKKKIGLAELGEKNSRYKIDRSELSKKEDKRTYAYADWRNQVYKRDNWKCRLTSSECCGRIEAHHIFNWADYPELRYIISNGITLCHFHHPYKWSEEERMIPIFQEIICKKE